MEIVIPPPDGDCDSWGPLSPGGCLDSEPDQLYFKCKPILITPCMETSRRMKNRFVTQEFQNPLYETAISVSNDDGEVRIPSVSNRKVIVLSREQDYDYRISQKQNMIIIKWDSVAQWNQDIKPIFEKYKNIQHRVFVTKNTALAPIANSINAILVPNLKSESLIRYLGRKNPLEAQLNELFGQENTIQEDHFHSLLQQKYNTEGRLDHGQQLYRSDLMVPIDNQTLYTQLRSCGFPVRAGYSFALAQCWHFAYSSPSKTPAGEPVLTINCAAQMDKSQRRKRIEIAKTNLLATAQKRDLLVITLKKRPNSRPNISSMIDFVKNVFLQGERKEEFKLLRLMMDYQWDYDETSTEIIIYVSGPIFGENLSASYSPFSAYRKLLSSVSEPCEIQGSLTARSGLAQLLPYVSGVFTNQLFQSLIDTEVSLNFNSSLLDLIGTASDLVPALSSLSKYIENPNLFSEQQESLIEWLLAEENISGVQEVNVDRFIQKFGVLVGDTIDFTGIQVQMFIDNFDCDIILSDSTLTDLSKLNVSIHK